MHGVPDNSVGVQVLADLGLALEEVGDPARARVVVLALHVVVLLCTPDAETCDNPAVLLEEVAGRALLDREDRGLQVAVDGLHP
eukprot:10767366-Lingulodinium_polyedra.AAC.1